MADEPKPGWAAVADASLEEPPTQWISSALIGALTAAAVAVTAGVTAAGAGPTTGASGNEVVLEAVGRAVVVGVPLAVALYACNRPAHARFGRLLLVVSVVWLLSSLSTSVSPVLYSVGRVAGWVAEPALVYALLAFPAGRLTTRVDRGLVVVSIATLLLYLPTALLVATYPAPSPWSSCYLGCPHNAFMVLSHQPAFVDSFLVPAREVLTVIVFLLVAGRLAVRIRGASPLMRRTLTPVLAAAGVRWAAFAVLIVARRISPDSTFVEAGAWALALGVPAIALGFLVGLARWHLFVTAGIRKINARILEMPGPEQVRELLAAAFEDPRLQIASWSRRQRHWVAVDGALVDDLGAESGRSCTEVRDGRRRVVAIVHDEALREDRAFVEAAAAAASMAFASDKVATRTAGMVSELRASRSRILAAADDERRRIERDLHDGAQQRLVGLCIHLELAAERAEREHPGEAAALRELITEVEQALEEIRSLTRGIYPATLLDRGLAVATRSAALRSAVPATVEVNGLGEYPDEIATAVYFCCTEALQNVAKHATGAHAVHIVLRETDSVLSFSVSDDGPGLVDRGGARVGAGMVNMRDRINTVGGQFSVQSRPGQGTRVSGRIPLTALDAEARDHGGAHGSHAARRLRDHGPATS
ncbi:MAG TPA: histidine kinase [Solirubrobacteraceae bacterium]